MYMPFGKHRGLPLNLIPNGYLEWVRDNCQLQSEELRTAILAEIADRDSRGIIVKDPPVGVAPARTPGGGILTFLFNEWRGVHPNGECPDLRSAYAFFSQPDRMTVQLGWARPYGRQGDQAWTNCKVHFTWFAGRLCFFCNIKKAGHEVREEFEGELSDSAGVWSWALNLTGAAADAVQAHINLVGDAIIRQLASDPVDVTEEEAVYEPPMPDWVFLEQQGWTKERVDQERERMIQNYKLRFPKRTRIPNVLLYWLPKFSADEYQEPIAPKTRKIGYDLAEMRKRLLSQMGVDNRIPDNSKLLRYLPAVLESASPFNQAEANAAINLIQEALRRSLTQVEDLASEQACER